MENWSLRNETLFDNRVIRHDQVGHGPPIVVIHGTPWSSYNMRHLIAGLSRSYSVYYYDLLGYGQSSKEDGDVSLGIQNTVLAHLLDHWGLKRPTVVAHDFGGATALRALLLNGASFDKLVLIDPVAISPWGSAFFRHVQSHEAALAGLPSNIHEAVVRAYIQSASNTPIKPETLDRTVEPWLGQDGQAAFYRQISQADSNFTEEIQHRFSELKLRTLVLWGNEDKWIPVSQAGELHALISSSKLKIIPDAGHLVVEENPAELLEEIMPFLQDRHRI